MNEESEGENYCVKCDTFFSWWKNCKCLIPPTEGLRSKLDEVMNTIMDNQHSAEKLILKRMGEMDLVKVENNRIVFTEDQVQQIKDIICKGASDDELSVFLTIAKRSGLDPFSKQIYMIRRWNSDVNRYIYAPQTSIDGFRLIAERTGDYQGQNGPFWCGEDGVWKDFWFSKEPPIASKVAVLRKGFTAPLWGISNYSEFLQTTKSGDANSMWKKMPAVMLAKCAESQALRKAFPLDLGGIYTDAEFGEEEEKKSPPMNVAHVIKPDIAASPQISPHEELDTQLRTSISNLSDNFKDKLRLSEIYNALNVMDPKEIPLADSEKKREWIEYLNTLTKKEN